MVGAAHAGAIDPPQRRVVPLSIQDLCEPASA
jgi:hypothetical protein